MNTKLITYAVAASMSAVSLAEPGPLQVTKESVQSEQVAGELMKPDAVFKIRHENGDSSIPELSIPAYSTMRSRVVDVRQSQDRMEVAIQVDELGIDYYDYRLKEGEWVLNEKKRICSLNGVLALNLAQVDLLDGGTVKVAYRGESSGGRASSWANELLTKENRDNSGLLREEYKLQDGQFTLSSDPVRFRPEFAANTQKTEEQNKAQHPTDGAPEPEKPKE